MTALVSPGTRTLSEAAWEALGKVLDPELDEPITELGFVTSCQVGVDGCARVRLRVPTYFCAPNFVFLMVSDARDAVIGVPGIRHVDVLVDDHFAADEINAGAADGHGFVATFGDLAVAELDQLRVDFLRKAVLAATDRACRAILANGHSIATLADMRFGDLAENAELRRLRDRRKQLGLAADDNAYLVVDPATGKPIGATDLVPHLRRARLTRVSTEANGEICRNLLRGRYPETAITVRRGSRPMGGASSAEKRGSSGA